MSKQVMGNKRDFSYCIATIDMVLMTSGSSSSLTDFLALRPVFTEAAGH